MLIGNVVLDSIYNPAIPIKCFNKIFIATKLKITFSFHPACSILYYPSLSYKDVTFIWEYELFLIPCSARLQVVVFPC